MWAIITNYEKYHGGMPDGEAEITAVVDLEQLKTITANGDIQFEIVVKKTAEAIGD